MASGPLNGIRVLEFTQIIAGPLGCQMLSDLGADVIKVEPPEGEPWRLNAMFVPFESKAFQTLNRGKRSLAMDLSAPIAQEAVHRLVRDMDVVVINYRPDVAARLCIDYDTLRTIKPDLIYVDVTAFGRRGELADRPGYDIVIQAASGLLSMTGKVDERGTPVVTSPPVADATTGYAIAVGVCAALFHRSRTGEGQKVETSLLANALQVENGMFSSVPGADGEERARFVARVRDASEEGISYSQLVQENDVVRRVLGLGNFYYRCFLTSDGAIAIGALSASLRAKVRNVLGVQHNRDDPGYNPRDPDQQQVDRKAVEQVEKIIAAKPTEYWERAFDAGGVPVSRVRFVQELIDEPQVLANEYVVALEHDLTGPQRQAAPPWRMSASPPAAQSASPPLGRDNDSILSSLGFEASKIAEMRSAGIIR